MTKTNFKECPSILFLVFWTLLIDGRVVNTEFNSLEENVFFDILWPGPASDLLKTNDEKTIVMTTVNDEKYKCILPDSDSDSQDNDGDYMGPSALELIRPLFNKFTCILRFEHFWVYELCHGRHLRQYHEEKEAGQPEVLQEYYLGRYDLNKFDENKQSPRSINKQKVLHRSIEGIIMPYVTINMTGGTVCDLSGKPRETRVMYACHPSSKQEIYSIEETLTCEYEVLVLTNLLCEHPDYRLRSPKTNDIHCHSLDKTKTRPIILQDLETDSLILNPNSPLNAMKTQFDSTTTKQTKTDSTAESKPTETHHSIIAQDSKIVQEFLEGKHCLRGGSGWWKYEFCYGDKVEQFHEDTGHRKTVITLGKWNRDKHVQWLEKNPHKKPKFGTRRHISHYYSEGDFCIEAASSRRVEVKLRCKDSSDHPNAVSLYLLEPRTCEYILVVESPILCSLLPNVDESGIFREPISK